MINENQQISKNVSGKSVGLKNLRPWKKWQSGNPKGGPKKAFTSLNEEIKREGWEVVTGAMINEAYSLLFSLTEMQLKKIEDDMERPMIIRMVAKNMLSPRWYDVLGQMLDRSHGKARQNIKSDISGDFTLAGALLSLSRVQQKEEF